jgi:hypothetical protein
MLMQSIWRVCRILLGFVWEAAYVGGLGFTYFVVPFLIAVGLLLFTFMKQDAASRKALLPPILILPTIWICMGLWDGFFFVDLRHPVSNPAWVGHALTVAAALFIVATGFYIWRLAGARLFVIGYALMNLYFTIAMWFLGEMAISGDWL